MVQIKVFLTSITPNGAAGPMYVYICILDLIITNRIQGKALDYESRDCRFDPCVAQKVDFFALISVGNFPFFFFAFLSQIFCAPQRRL